MANTKITIRELNFKIDEAYTHVTVKFEADNDQALGTIRTNKFPLIKSVQEILTEELNDFKYLSWPEGDHMPRMTPADYRIVREVVRFLKSGNGLNQWRYLTSEEYLKRAGEHVAKSFGVDNIGFGDDQYKTVKEVCEILEGHMSMKKVDDSNATELCHLVTNNLILMRFNVCK